MAEKTTVARPYAQAIFKLAQEKDTLQQWSDDLQLLSMIVSDSAMQQLIKNPAVEKKIIVDVIIGVCGDKADVLALNFIRVLVENRRLVVFSEIVQLFDLYRADVELTQKAEVISAFPVSEEQKTSIAAALKAKLGREVSLTTSVDESLVGGAIIRAGDLVIDGSVLAHLSKLKIALTH